LSGVAYEGQSDIANTNFYGTLNMIFAQEPAFDIIFVGLGANDFATYRADGYQEVANGSVTPQQKIDKILASFNTLMAAVRAKAPTTPVRVHLITPNLIDSIAAGLGYTPTQRNLVMQAMVGVNNGMMAYDASDPYTQALDFETAFHAPYIGLGADGYWNYLGYHINFFQACDDPRICGSVEPASAPHPSIWGEGMIANWHLAVIAQTLGINIPPLTDAEMLQLAGLSAVPTPTATPVVPTATLTNTPAPTITPTVIPQEAAYIRIHIVGQTDQIIPLPPTYERVTGFCSGNANYIGIQEPGVSFRKYVCWS
ncbi:MAG: hypothetical protein K8I82_16690, partial [Anaerolineae bacterium]|nr:hypothetical protein [Anaerolineae bacterium]